jgi:hypothetical protein
MWTVSTIYSDAIRLSSSIRLLQVLIVMLFTSKVLLMYGIPSLKQRADSDAVVSDRESIVINYHYTYINIKGIPLPLSGVSKKRSSENSWNFQGRWASSSRAKVVIDTNLSDLVFKDFWRPQGPKFCESCQIWLVGDTDKKKEKYTPQISWSITKKIVSPIGLQIAEKKGEYWFLSLKKVLSTKMQNEKKLVEKFSFSIYTWVFSLILWYKW